MREKNCPVSFDEAIVQFNSFTAFFGALAGVQFVFVSAMTTQTNFPTKYFAVQKR